MGYLHLTRMPVCDKDDLATLEFSMGDDTTKEQRENARDALIWVVGPATALFKSLWLFDNPGSVGVFMMGRNLSKYQLYVCGRKYPWTDGTSDNPADIMNIVDQIEYYIDLEASFYENAQCIRYLERQRVQQKKRVDRWG